MKGYDVRRLLAILALCIFAGAHTAHAQPITCGTDYTVGQGDDLQSIAKRAYGNEKSYAILQSVNSIRNPAFLSIGAVLRIPCVGAARDQASSIRLPVLKSPVGGGIKVITGTEYPPFVGENLRNKGLSRELIERALQTASRKLDYSIVVDPKWGDHLDPGLRTGKYDIAFPWFKPDCRFYSKLGKSSRYRCDELRFSEALNELVVTFYGRYDDDSPAEQPRDLFGKTLCRPSGYFTFDLEERDLVPPNIKLVMPATPTACFEMLAKKEVDYVTINSDTGDQTVTKLKLNDTVRDLIDLATIQTLHAVVSKRHPRGRALLLRITQGLRKMKRNGVYRAVVEEHLANR